MSFNLNAGVAVAGLLLALAGLIRDIFSADVGSGRTWTSTRYFGLPVLALSLFIIAAGWLVTEEQDRATLQLLHDVQGLRDAHARVAERIEALVAARPKDVQIRSLAEEARRLAAPLNTLDHIVKTRKGSSASEIERVRGGVAELNRKLDAVGPAPVSAALPSISPETQEPGRFSTPPVSAAATQGTDTSPSAPTASDPAPNRRDEESQRNESKGSILVKPAPVVPWRRPLSPLLGISITTPVTDSVIDGNTTIVAGRVFFIPEERVSIARGTVFAVVVTFVDPIHSVSTNESSSFYVAPNADGSWQTAVTFPRRTGVSSYRIVTVQSSSSDARPHAMPSNAITVYVRQ